MMSTPLLRNFYPGSIWPKRLLRLAVVYAIGLNLFINDFQEHTLMLINEQSCEITAITESIDAEQYRLSKVQKESWTERGIDLMAYWTDSPDSEQINTLIDYSDHTLNRLEDINQGLAQVDEGTAVAMHVLRYTSWFMWWPIALSLLWLLIDVVKGGEGVFVVAALIISIPFSFWSYSHLGQLVGMMG